MPSSSNYNHPWSNLKAPDAERCFKELYPSIYEWFDSFGDTFKKRGERGRFFWELRSCSYYEDFLGDKIIYPDMSDRCSFTLDKFGFYPNCTTFSIPSSSKFLLGILNSVIFQFFFYRRSPLNQNNFMRFKKSYLSGTPIPKASEEEKKAIEELVEKCLAAKGVGVEEWEAAIDEKVAQLYGLTPTEINLIKGD